MSIRRITSPQAPAPGGAYSHAVVLGDVVYTSGTLPFDPATGELVAGGIAEQTRRTLDNVDAVLRSAGSSLERVVKCNVYCTPDESHFGLFNEAYERYFPTGGPARIFMHVPSWPGPFDIEIDCVAVI